MTPVEMLWFILGVAAVGTAVFLISTYSVLKMMQGVHDG